MSNYNSNWGHELQDSILDLFKLDDPEYVKQIREHFTGQYTVGVALNVWYDISFYADTSDSEEKARKRLYANPSFPILTFIRLYQIGAFRIYDPINPVPEKNLDVALFNTLKHPAVNSKAREEALKDSHLRKYVMQNPSLTAEEMVSSYYSSSDQEDLSKVLPKNIKCPSSLLEESANKLTRIYNEETAVAILMHPNLNTISAALALHAIFTNGTISCQENMRAFSKPESLINNFLLNNGYNQETVNSLPLEMKINIIV